ncbi:MAG: hypothetical protein ACTHOJ_17875 [Sphingomonas oligoaromativorans]
MVQAAMAAASSVIKGVGGYESGRYNKQADYAAATDAEQQGADQEAQIRANARGIIGQQIAAQGASGFQMGTGSALEALTQSQVNATTDALTARRNAAERARTYRMQGDVAMAQGRNALVQGLIGGGASAAQTVDWAAPQGGKGYYASLPPTIPTYGGGPNADGSISVMSGYNGG